MAAVSVPASVVCSKSFSAMESTVISWARRRLRILDMQTMGQRIAADRGVAGVFPLR